MLTAAHGVAALPPRTRYELTGEGKLPRVKVWRCQSPSCRHDWKAERSQVDCPACGGDDVCLAPGSMQEAI